MGVQLEVGGQAGKQRMPVWGLRMAQSLWGARWGRGGGLAPVRRCGLREPGEGQSEGRVGSVWGAPRGGGDEGGKEDVLVESLGVAVGRGSREAAPAECCRPAGASR